MTPIPKVRDDDDEDVSWALSTAESQYARGDRAEALKWLRRAAEAASEAEHDARALELAKAAADLAQATQAPPRTELTPKAPPAAASKPAPKAKPSQVTPPPPPPAKRRSKADETGKRSAVKHVKRSPDPADNLHTDPEAERPVHAAEADAWPTETMNPTELDALGDVYGLERTRIGAMPYREPDPAQPAAVAFRASQAVQVIVWRAPDGTLRVAPKGTSVSAVTIDALLVAPAPDVDLLAWLSD